MNLVFFILKWNRRLDIRISFFYLIEFYLYLIYFININNKINGKLIYSIYYVLSFFKDLISVNLFKVWYKMVILCMRFCVLVEMVFEFVLEFFSG